LRYSQWVFPETITQGGKTHMKVYYICESCQEVFYEGKLGEEEGILTVDALCPDCAEELNPSGEMKFTNHFYS
jgi:DNA polymerase III alpha subunit (gram-positive type)